MYVNRCEGPEFAGMYLNKDIMLINKRHQGSLQIDQWLSQVGCGKKGMNKFGGIELYLICGGGYVAV